MGWNVLGIFLIVSAVLCAIGFYKYVYFLSIGYGFAIAGLGVAIAVLFHGQMNAVGYIQCLLFFIYGARLSGFLLYREIKNASYRKTLKDVTSNEATMPVFVKISIWLCVSVLYVAQISPVFYRTYNRASDTVLPVIGIVLSIAAIIIESLADYQKTQQKKENPNMVATKGLYKIVRCPNYFGEILFWTGVTVGSFTALNSVGQWIMVIAAYISIVGIMFSGAKRLEKRQITRYGNMPEYISYTDKTPIIIPLMPVYHLCKEKDNEKK